MRSRVAVVFFAFAVGGCAAILGIDDGTPRSDAGTFDAGVDAIDDVAREGEAAVEASIPSCAPNAPFTSIKPIAELNTPATEQHPRLLPDEKTVVFQRQPSGFVVFTATRPDRFSAFGSPVQTTELVAAGDAADPSLDPSGLRIAFASSRTGGLGSYDLWTATRPTLGSPFATPTPIAGASDVAIDHYPSFAGANALYFSSARTGGLGSEDIYRIPVNGTTFGAPALVDGLSHSGYDAAPAVTADELVAYIERSYSDDAGTTGAIFVSSRAKTSDPWPTPTVVLELRGGESIPAWISPDRCRLYFSSTRSGNLDLFVAERLP